MYGPATIDHQEVHIDLNSRNKQGQGHETTAVTSQPSTISGHSNVQYDRNTAMAVFTESPAPIVAQKLDPKLKPKDFVITSCAVLFACNFIFGFLGYHFGVKSNYAWQLGDIDTAKKQARRALIFVIIGVIVGIATYVLAFVLYFVVFDSPPHEVENRQT